MFYKPLLAQQIKDNAAFNGTCASAQIKKSRQRRSGAGIGRAGGVIYGFSQELGSINTENLPN
jgi:hypothetical protein